MQRLFHILRKVAIITFIALFALMLGLYFIIQIPIVQTKLVHWITQSIQKQLPESTISVGSVHYVFFNKLIISDVYASDIHGDTLLYVKHTAVRLSFYSSSEHRLSLSSVNLYDGVFNLYDGPKTNNIKEVLSGISKSGESPDTIKTKEPLRLLVKNIALSNFRFTYRNLRNPTQNPDPTVIDFKNLGLSKINVDIRGLSIRNDSIFFKIKNINFSEQSGYNIKQLSAENVYICANQVMLKKLIIDDEFSYLTLNHYSMSFTGRNDFGQYPEKVTMDADIDNSTLSFKTINHYAKGLNVEKLNVQLHGRVTGPVCNLSSSQLSIIKTKSNTRILTSFKMSGLPDINKTGLSLQLQELNTNAKDLSEIIHDFMGDNYTASTDQIIRRLGTIHFKGSFDGMYNDFVSYGAIETSIGSATVDMLFHKTSQRSFTAEGDVHLQHFNLGQFLDMPMLGEMSTNAEAILTFNPSDNESFNFKLTGDIPRFDFNRYTYSNIKIVDGQISDRSFEGEIKINDPNLKMDFNGSVAYNQRNDSSFVLRHIYKADIQYANLAALNFNTRDTVSEIKTLITSNFNYNKTIDGGRGKIEATNIYYRDKETVHNIGDISLLFAQSNNGYRTQLRSKFANIDYSGPLPLFNFITDFSHIFYIKHLPLLGDSSKYSINRSSDYSFTLQVRNNFNELAHIIMPGLQVENQSKVKVTITPANILSLDLESPGMALHQYKLNGVNMEAHGSNERLDVTIGVDNALLADFDIDINTVINVTQNNIDTEIKYDNNSDPVNKGQIYLNTSFAENLPPRFPITNIALLKNSKLTINDTIWKIDPAKIVIDGPVFNFGRVSFSNLHQEIALEGTISPGNSDTLSLFFTNFELSNINLISNKQGYTFQGVLSGKAQVTDVYDKPMFYVNADAQQVKVNNRPLDNISVRSRWDNESQAVRLRTEIKEGNTLKMLARGIYKPAKDSIGLTTTFTHFPVVHVEPLLRGVLSKIGGSLSGEITTTGSLKTPLLYGKGVRLDSLKLTVDYLNTHYSLTTPVDITPNLIKIQDAAIHDGANGQGTFNGTFRHQGFRNIKYDMDISANNLLCMNTTIKDNELFYGKAYATGQVRIKGDDANIHFDITAVTGPNTVCNIPLSNPAQTKESNILIFKEPEIANDNEENLPVRNISKVKPGQHLTVDINLTVTPNADIQLIFDEKAGDIIKGKGNGNIGFSIDPSIDKFDLFGDYAITEGNYLFTLQNIISKYFIMEQGSHISFNGDLYKTTVDITAVYKTKASLNTLLADTSNAGSMRRNIDCRILITGNLFSPNLSYKVEVQNLDANIRAQVEAAMNSDEKMMRQFISLLTLGSFMPDDQSGISSINITASASEILSNQLSNMLTQLNVPFDLGFMYNTTATGNDVWDIAVSTQLFNNRLIINGAFGNTKTYNSDFTNDIDLELKFDKQGRFRGKAFTHSSDQFTNQIDYSQRSGVGFIFQEDFNSFHELFKRWFGKKKKADAVVKEEEKKGEEEKKEEKIDENK